MATVSKRKKALAEKHLKRIGCTIEEAAAGVKECATAKFDETIELAFTLGVDPRHAEQMVRGSVSLPHGTGRHVRVVVFCKETDQVNAAKQAGALEAGAEELLAKVQGGWTDFDVAIATPDMMGKAGRLGRVLGPRGLMPNPKAGTVVPAEDLPRVIREAKAGRVEFRLDKTANIHVPIGKTSFEVEKLYENFATLMDAIKKARPSAARGTYIRRVTITATMGPGVKVDALAAQNM